MRKQYYNNKKSKNQKIKKSKHNKKRGYTFFLFTPFNECIKKLIFIFLFGRGYHQILFNMVKNTGGTKTKGMARKHLKPNGGGGGALLIPENEL